MQIVDYPDRRLVLLNRDWERTRTSGWVPCSRGHPDGPATALMDVSERAGHHATSAIPGLLLQPIAHLAATSDAKSAFKNSASISRH
ncbi:hypothetical protein [Streptomyces kronopolitis]|uniref:hypothetical protein n=1 Tax=Streptomyces kronopolitis TaxID=1612435 RepID=UPI0020C13C3A|nr:hypothetical protein [Streptomyces kronopolitis]MCL6296883.1 hypothetical protein [Streptomyces kronopolitis]